MAAAAAVAAVAAVAMAAPSAMELLSESLPDPARCHSLKGAVEPPDPRWLNIYGLKIIKDG